MSTRFAVFVFAWTAGCPSNDEETTDDDDDDDAPTDATHTDTDSPSNAPDVDDDGDGASENDGDCDDADELVHPGATEICGNGVDEDCDGVVDDLADDTTTVGPLPYLEAADSPWASLGLDTFVVEDVEDSALPDGVTAAPFLVTSYVFASHTSTDSVDGDDGDPTNNACNPCESLWSNTDVTFTFDPVALGGLPTHVGIVFTDSGTTKANVALTGTTSCAGIAAWISPFIDDGLYLGSTAEDRFFGFVQPAGMVSVTISQSGFPFEIDHLQYGW